MYGLPNVRLYTGSGFHCAEVSLLIDESAFSKIFLIVVSRSDVLPSHLSWLGEQNSYSLSRYCIGSGTVLGALLSMGMSKFALGS